jgi:hypothetical protein
MTEPGARPPLEEADLRCHVGLYELRSGLEHDLDERRGLTRLEPILELFTDGRRDTELQTPAVVKATILAHITDQ